MNNVHHKSIKRFHLDGHILDDASFWRLKDQYVRLLTTNMRLSGYVPRLDIQPDFTLDYNEEKQYFEFELSLYGIYLGKKQSQWIDGVEGTLIVYTQMNKSSVSSQAAV
jgi:hypothetical protein